MTTRIIDGKRYNTDTATEIHDWWNGYPNSNFKHCYETLYRTPRGKFFTVGSSGPMSKYARSVAGGTSGDTDVITILTDLEARQWCRDSRGRPRPNTLMWRTPDDLSHRLSEARITTRAMLHPR